MSVRARTRPLYGKYAFTVQDLSSGITQAKFAKCSGLGMTINIGELAEGGAQAPMKEATTASFSDVTLTHGVMADLELYNWCLECINILANPPEGTGVDSPDQLRNLLLTQLKRSRNALFYITLYNSQPKDFKPAEFDNSSTELQVEELQLAYEYFDKVLA